MRKRIISMFLVLCMMLGMVPAMAAQVTFDDIAGHWAETAITQLASKGIVNGSWGKFRPGDNITRGEVATIFDNLMGYQIAAENTFSDLPADKWYTKNMLKANAAGIFAGDGGDTMRPEAQITRQEFFVTLARLLVLPDSATPGKFTDQKDISDWAAPKMNALAQVGLLAGVDNGDGTFRAEPLKQITRAEVATMIARAFPGIYNVAGTYSDPVVGSATVSTSGVNLTGTKVSADLFIAPGVGDGEVTLDSVNAPNRTFIDGGGANSVIFKGDSVFGAIITNKSSKEKPLTLKLEGNTTADNITITDQSAQTNIVVSGNAKVALIEAANAGTVISGNGKVSAVNITANNVTVDTRGTKVIVAEGVTGTMVDGKAVAGGKTVTSKSGSSNDSGNSTGPVQPENTWAVRFETDGGTLVDANGKEYTVTYVVKGLKLDPVPQAKKADAIFLGWYTDKGLTTQFFASEALTGNITLYAKYETMEKKQQQKVDSFALSDEAPNKTFTINAPGMTEVQVRNAITLTNIGAGGTPELKITETSSGSGTFTVAAKDDYREGATITLHLGEGLTFDGMEPQIRNASFTIAKKEVDNLKLNEDMPQIKIADAGIKDIKEAVVEEDGTVTPGSFTVPDGKLGGKKLAVGDNYVLYEELTPEKCTDLNADYSENTIIYAKIVEVDTDLNTAGNQVSYTVVEQKELLAMPESLPLDVDDLVADSYTGKGDLNFEISNATLFDTDKSVGYWADYDHIGLNNDTTIDVGDSIILMGVPQPGAKAGEPVEDTEESVVYGTVTEVEKGDTNTTVTFALTDAETIMKKGSEEQNFYTAQDVNYEEIVKEAKKAGIPEQIEKQALESGFADEAMNYLLETATKTEGYQEAVRRAGPNIDIGTPGFGEGWLPNVTIPAFAAKGFTIKAKITNEGDHYDGLMCQLYIEGNVEIPLDPKAAFPDKIVIDMKATFEQELKIVFNMDGGIEWSWAAFIPYPSDVYVNTNVDVFDYTAIKLQAKIKTVAGDNIVGGVIDMLEDLEEVDISGEIQDLLAMTDGDEQMAGTEKLFAMYGAMLETETDYITLVEQEIFDKNANYMKIFAVGVTGNFVIKANVNLVIGSSLEYESGNRYNFWFKLFSGTSGSSNTRLIDEKMKFQFYVMGTIGIKVGVNLEIYAGIVAGDIKLATVGFGAEAGAYVDLYGYFVYEVVSLNEVTSSEMAGALYVDFGIYLEVYFFARAGEDVAGGLAEYAPMLVDKKWPLISAGEKINVYDFTYDEIPASEKYYIKNYTTDYLPDSYWSMKGMDLIKGDLVDLIYPRDRFVYTLSNPAFKFDPASGQVEVTVPTNTRYMECDMTIKWTGDKLAFSTSDLMRTVHLVWTNLADEEMSLRHNISVVADGNVIWSKVVGEGEQYALPTEAELKELLEFGKYIYKDTDLKYSGGTLKYTNENKTVDNNGQAKILNADRDRIYTVDVTPRVYKLPVAGVQNADGTVDADFKLYGKFGETFDLAPLLASGANDATVEKPYTVYARTDSVEKDPTVPEGNETAPIGKPLDTKIDPGFAKQIIDKTFEYKAQYNDNFVTATFNFVDSRGEKLGTPQTVKVEKDHYADFDYQAYALNMVNDTDYMVKRFDKSLEKLTADETYTATCVLAIGTAYPIVFSTGDDDVSVDNLPRHSGAHLTLPRPEREGYTFAGWNDADGNPFKETNMPTPTQSGTEALEKAFEDATAAAELATKADAEAKADVVTATTADAEAKAAVVTAQKALDDALTETPETPEVETPPENGGDETADPTETTDTEKTIETTTFGTPTIKELEEVLAAKILLAEKAAAELITATTTADTAAKEKTAADKALEDARKALAEGQVLSLRLYAKWTANTYTVTFDDNAPTVVVAGVPTPITVTYGESYPTAALRDLRRSGYKFDGWFTEKDGGTKVSTVNEAENHTLYAQWTAKELIEDSYFTNFAQTKPDGTGDVTFAKDYSNDRTAVPYKITRSEEVSTVPLDSFIVQYKGSNPVYSANKWVWFADKDENGEALPGKQNVGPIDSERYDVMIYRAEDETYQMYKRVVPAGVVISKIDRPAGVVITLPTKATNKTYNSVTVNPATTTSDVKGADDGTILYQMETLEITIIRSSGAVTRSEQKDITEWTDTRTLLSNVENTPKSTNASYEYRLERRISAKIGGARNYNDSAPTSTYFTVDATAPLKDKSKEITSNVHIEIKTSEKASSGTSSEIYMELLDYRSIGKDAWNEFEAYQIHTDKPMLSKGYKTGELANHDRTVTTDPWMLGGEFLLWRDGGTEEWRYDYADFTLKNTINGEQNVKTGYDSMDDSTRRDRKYKFAEQSVFQRAITSVGTFATWGGEHTVTADSKGKIAYTFDGKITDQYGTYNAYDHYDAPTIRVGALNREDKLIASPFQDVVSYSNYGVEIDEAKLYARMLAAELTTVTFTVKLDVPSASCKNAADEMFTKTITITRA